MLPPDIKEWDEAVCNSYKLDKVVIENDASVIKLFSPGINSKYYSSAPYFYDGGVNLADDRLDKNTYARLQKLIQEKKLKYILLKTRKQIGTDVDAHVEVDSDYFTFILDLSSGEDYVWKNRLKSTTRNQVRKADKQGFGIETGNEELLPDFYSVISEAWRDLGTPTHGMNFYSSILSCMKEKSKLMVVYNGTTPISCALLLMLDDVIYHPYSCSLNKFKSTCVNNLLYWEIIKFACDKGYSRFDMGRSRIDQGTYKYKKSWGADPVRLFYTYILDKECNMPSLNSTFYKYATGAWKYMPISLANALGPSLIKNIL